MGRNAATLAATLASTGPIPHQYFLQSLARIAPAVGEEVREVCSVAAQAFKALPFSAMSHEVVRYDDICSIPDVLCEAILAKKVRKARSFLNGTASRWAPS